VRFVVLDTYAMMTQGIDENSSQYVGTVMEALSHSYAKPPEVVRSWWFIIPAKIRAKG
jgi:hypothetical protein